MLRQALASTLLASFVFASAGCLVTSSNDVAESGVAVSSSTLNQIMLGETTEAWLVATLGEPNERTAVADRPNVSILKYRHVVDRESDGSIFLLFAGSSKSKHQSTAYFEIIDGVVSRYWIERARL